jgi:hypothetical protein
MKFAYADPPYLGRGEYYTAYHADAKRWDDPETHRALIDRLCAEYPDGWCFSLSEKSLQLLLPMCPVGVRVCAWITASPRYAGNNVGVRRHFEPVILFGGRDTRNRAADYIVTRPEPTGEPRYRMVKSDLRSGKTFVGRKPQAFAHWVLDLLGVAAGDTVDDLFPGSGAVGIAISERLQATPQPFGLFKERTPA